MAARFRRGDIVLTRGDSFVSKAIRWFSRVSGESRTMVNHVAIVTADGDSATAEIVEALTTVKKRKLKVYRRHPKTAVAVYRPLNVTPEQIDTIVDYSLSTVGRSYGHHMLVAHALDRLVFNHGYVVRRLVGMEKYPICSWIIAQAYSRAGFTFGVAPGQADPDDIWDHVVVSDHYTAVHHLGELP